MITTVLIHRDASRSRWSSMQKKRKAMSSFHHALHGALSTSRAVRLAQQPMPNQSQPRELPDTESYLTANGCETGRGRHCEEGHSLSIATTASSKVGPAKLGKNGSCQAQNNIRREILLNLNPNALRGHA